MTALRSVPTTTALPAADPDRPARRGWCHQVPAPRWPTAPERASPDHLPGSRLRRSTRCRSYCAGRRPLWERCRQPVRRAVAQIAGPHHPQTRLGGLRWLLPTRPRRLVASAPVSSCGPAQETRARSRHPRTVDLNIANGPSSNRQRTSAWLLYPIYCSLSEAHFRRALPSFSVRLHVWHRRYRRTRFGAPRPARTLGGHGSRAHPSRAG